VNLKNQRKSILLSAFQIPGCVKDINPTIITLNNGLLYQRVKRETGLTCTSVSSISGSSGDLVDIFADSTELHVVDAHDLIPLSRTLQLHQTRLETTTNILHINSTSSTKIYAPTLCYVLIGWAHEKGLNGLDAYGVIRCRDDENVKRECLVVRIMVAATCCLDKRLLCQEEYRVL
jgi:hypothetical protein